MIMEVLIPTAIRTGPAKTRFPDTRMQTAQARRACRPRAWE